MYYVYCELIQQFNWYFKITFVIWGTFQMNSGKQISWFLSLKQGGILLEN